jgi:hypothetical protein
MKAAPFPPIILEVGVRGCRVEVEVRVGVVEAVWHYCVVATRSLLTSYLQHRAHHPLLLELVKRVSLGTGMG